jgi:hypothetical protein
MTWSEWVSSSYNTGEVFFISGSEVWMKSHSGNPNIVVGVSPNSTITADGAYEITMAGN